MKELKEKEQRPMNNGLFPNAMGDVFGVPYIFHIKPYLKKVKIVDVGQFQLRMPTPTFEDFGRESIGWKTWYKDIVAKKS